MKLYVHLHNDEPQVACEEHQSLLEGELVATLHIALSCPFCTAQQAYQAVLEARAYDAERRKRAARFPEPPLT